MVDYLANVLSVEQAAELLACEPETIETKLRAGELPGCKFGRSWMLPLPALMRHVGELAEQNLKAKRAPMLAPVGTGSVVNLADGRVTRRRRV